MRNARLRGSKLDADPPLYGVKIPRRITAKSHTSGKTTSQGADQVDANALIQSLTELLRRTIGENIELRTELAENLPTIVVDANQLENAIINLAINARAAMPDGGTLTVSTSLAETGDDGEDPFVSIAISDTGVGMDEATLRQVFEPFFTSKPIGQPLGQCAVAALELTRHGRC